MVALTSGSGTALTKSMAKHRFAAFLGNYCEMVFQKSEMLVTPKRSARRRRSLCVLSIQTTPAWLREDERGCVAIKTAVTTLVDKAIFATVRESKEWRQKKQWELSRVAKNRPEIKPLVTRAQEKGMAIGVAAADNFISALRGPNASQFVMWGSPLKRFTLAQAREHKTAPFLLKVNKERLAEKLLQGYARSIHNDTDALRRLEGNEKFLKKHLEEILGLNIAKGFRSKVPDKRVAFICWSECLAWIRHPFSYRDETDW